MPVVYRFILWQGGLFIKLTAKVYNYKIKRVQKGDIMDKDKLLAYIAFLFVIIAALVLILKVIGVI